MSPKIALITGITGQDGSYLADMLLQLGYEVHGIIRRSSSFHTERIDHIFERLHLHYGDLTDSGAISHIIARVKPDEIYNLGAQSHVMVSFEQPAYTTDTIVSGTMNVLEAVRHNRTADWEPRIYQASSSEMYGAVRGPQHENTAFEPQSPYAVAKVAAHHLAEFYRKAYDMFVCSGILFNHESPRRGPTFVTQKIVRALTAHKYDPAAEPLVLGSLWPMRDWGYAADYMEAAYLMMQRPEPDTFVIGTGETHTVERFLYAVGNRLDLDVNEMKAEGRVVVDDDRYVRPAEVPLLQANASKAMSVIGWKPKIDFQGLVDMMTSNEMRKHNEKH